jgi:hypothetical protein
MPKKNPAISIGVAKNIPEFINQTRQTRLLVINSSHTPWIGDRRRARDPPGSLALGPPDSTSQSATRSDVRERNYIDSRKRRFRTGYAMLTPTYSSPTRRNRSLETKFVRPYARLRYPQVRIVFRGPHAFVRPRDLFRQPPATPGAA